MRHGQYMRGLDNPIEVTARPPTTLESQESPSCTKDVQIGSSKFPSDNDYRVFCCQCDTYNSLHMVKYTTYRCLVDDPIP